MNIPNAFYSLHNMNTATTGRREGGEMRESGDGDSSSIAATAALGDGVGNSITAAVAEDCRDYLRTGRCKYGASCKYRHPPNVQSGGGMKGPINPSEPLYPIRPNEPVCQYFMKHGTCKFGQACKFHHPPDLAGVGGTQQSSSHHNSHINQPQHYHHQETNVQTQHQIVTLPNGNTVLVSMPVSANQASNGGATDGVSNRATLPGGVQILPQRPNEPICIFFLKNGRCKYGATCRYHHPLNYHSDRSGRGGGGGARGVYHHQQQQQQVTSPHIRYVAQLPPGSTMQQGHFVVADGNVTFLALDGNAHFVSIGPQQSGNGSGTTVASSTASSSSIASSFENVLSNTADGQDSSSSHWTSPANNARRQNLNGISYVDTAFGAAGRLNANQVSVCEASAGGQQNRTVYVQNVGDASSLGGLPRVVSASSTIASDPVFYDAGPSPSAWRGTRSSSFDHTRSRPLTSVQGGGDDCIHKSMSVHSALNEHASENNMRGRPPPGIRSPRQQSGQVDEGLSMMTSALLTMLDTPAVDTFDENFEYGTEDQGQSLTPRMGARYPAASNLSSAQRTSSRGSEMHPRQYESQAVTASSSYGRLQHPHQDHQHEYPLSLYGGDQGAPCGGEGSTLGNLSTHHSLESFQSSTNGSSNGWILEGNANESEISDSHHMSSSHNVGLYLP